MRGFVCNILDVNIWTSAGGTKIQFILQLYVYKKIPCIVPLQFVLVFASRSPLCQNRLQQRITKKPCNSQLQASSFLSKI
jgi:hypothetical protein